MTDAVDITDPATARSFIALHGPAWVDHRRLASVNLDTVQAEGDVVVCGVARLMRTDGAGAAALCTHHWLLRDDAPGVYACNDCGDTVEGEFARSLEDWWLERLDARERDAQRRLRARGAVFFSTVAEHWRDMGVAYSKRCGRGAAARTPVAARHNYAIAEMILAEMESVVGP